MGHGEEGHCVILLVVKDRDAPQDRLTTRCVPLISAIPLNVLQEVPMARSANGTKSGETSRKRVGRRAFCIQAVLVLESRDVKIPRDWREWNESLQESNTVPMR